MNIIKKIQHKIFQSNINKTELLEAVPSNTTRALDFGDHTNRAIRFNIYSANGGMVVETTRYDNVKDRQITGLYVINSDAELGEEISKIITMERLR